MGDEINEIIRVLQLTTYDEDEWDADNLTVMKKAQSAMEAKISAAHDWLQVNMVPYLLFRLCQKLPVIWRKHNFSDIDSVPTPSAVLRR